MIYHLATLPDWERALNSGFYTPSNWPEIRQISCFFELERLPEIASQFDLQHKELILLQMSERKVTLPQEQTADEQGNKYLLLKAKLSVAMVERTDMVFKSRNGSWEMA